MGKLDELRRSAMGNVDESMGGGPGAYTRGIAPPTRAMPARLAGITRSTNTAEIPVDKIVPDPGQPREEFDEEALGRLAETLREHGQLQALAVRWDEGAGVYRIIAGERRWRAARIAGLSTLTCAIWDKPLDPGQLLAVQCVENLSRDDLKPMEQAKAFRSLMELNGWSGNQLAKALGVNQPTVARALALLELPTAVQEHVEAGTLAPASAYEVSKIPDPEEQAAVAARVVAEGLTRAETVEAVRKAASRAPANPKGRGAAGKGKVARKVTERSIRTPSGPRVSIEFRKGLDAAAIETALAEALAIVRAEATAEVPRAADAA